MLHSTLRGKHEHQLKRELQTLFSFFSLFFFGQGSYIRPGIMRNVLMLIHVLVMFGI